MPPWSHGALSCVASASSAVDPEHSSTRCERGWGPTVACSLIVSLRGVISTQYVKKTEGQRGEAVVFPVIVPVHLETRCKHTRHAGRKHVVCEQRA